MSIETFNRSVTAAPKSMRRTDKMVIIVSHVSRSAMLERLQGCLDSMGIQHYALVDGQGGGAKRVHVAALKLAQDIHERQKRDCIIMEDDAWPVVGFMRKADKLVSENKGRNLSFYLGTSRPAKYQGQISVRVNTGVDYWTHRDLIHAVCYFIPGYKLKRLNSRLAGISEPSADFAIGQAAWDGQPFIYPTSSLVEHLDPEPVEKHPDGEKRTEPRKAWKLDGSLYNPE